MYHSGLAIPSCQCTETQPAQDRRDLQGGWSVIVDNEYNSHGLFLNTSGNFLPAIRRCFAGRADS